VCVCVCVPMDCSVCPYGLQGVDSHDRSALQVLHVCWVRRCGMPLRIRWSMCVGSMHCRGCVE
jgi:hypothetical protein